MPCSAAGDIPNNGKARIPLFPKKNTKYNTIAVMAASVRFFRFVLTSSLVRSSKKLATHIIEVVDTMLPNTKYARGMVNISTIVKRTIRNPAT